jgi:hypothetical protein
MRPLLGIVFLLHFATFIIAQTGSIKIEGSINDSETGESIENVNISVVGYNIGTTSGPLGEFSLTINKLPFTLEFSHINFAKKSISYEFIPLQNLTIKLNSKTEQLSEVTITSQKIDIIYEDDEYSVLDYELTEKGVLLLIFKNRLSRAELLYVNYESEELAQLKVLPLKPLMLFKDCLDKTNILSKDYVRQIHFDDDKIELYKPVKLEHYKKIMGGCEFLIKHKLYFADNSYYDLIREYYYIDTADKSRHIFATAHDYAKMDFLSDNPENLLYVDGKGGPVDMNDLRSLPGDASILNAIRNSNVTLRFNKMAYYSEIYAPVFSLGDTICIFNHPNDQILFYGLNDSLISQTEITYHKTTKKTEAGTFIHAFANPNKWLEEVYIDKQQRKAYTMFQNLEGTRDFKEINLETGEVTFIMTIPFPYVQKIKVKAGSLFFVYKDWGLHPQKKLYRQKIN